MASLKNVRPCTFFSFEFFWWKTRYCLEPLTSCQYSDVLCTHKTRCQFAQGWAGDKSETSFVPKLVLNRCTWTYIGWEVHRCTTVEDGANGCSSSLILRVLILAIWCVYPSCNIKMCEILSKISHTRKATVWNSSATVAMDTQHKDICTFFSIP